MFLPPATELMKNQKPAQTVSNQEQFSALQTSDGNALFFGIGSITSTPTSISMTMPGVLLAGGWRSVTDLPTDEGDLRNTLIATLGQYTSCSTADLQTLTDDTLVGKAAIVIALRAKAIRTDDELHTMELDVERNTLIAALETTTTPSSVLQPLNDQDLATQAMETWFAPKLYMTPETPNTPTGWTPVDLTTELQSALPGQTIAAKLFAVSQDATSGDIVIAQVVHTLEDDTDHLFVLTGLSHDPAAPWLGQSSTRNWLPGPPSLSNDSGDSDIAYLQILPKPQTPNAAYLAVFITGPQSTSVDPCAITVDLADPTDPWSAPVHLSSVNQLLDMALGLDDQGLPGLYTLGVSPGGLSLIFDTTWGTTRQSAILDAPPLASAIAALQDPSSNSLNLYIAAGAGIYILANFPNPPVQIISDPLVTGVDFFEVHAFGTQVTLWGRNSQGTVFYSSCPSDQQLTAESWAPLIPISQDAEQVTSLLDRQTRRSELFVQTTGQHIKKLTQDPVTTHWRSQTLLTPALDVNDVVEIYTFTTHVDVVDVNGMPVPNASVAMTASSPVAVYINGVYTTLSHDTPTQVQFSPAATLTIIQETETLGAACYGLVQGDNETVVVNPMAGLYDTLASVSNPGGLDITVTDELGNQTSLLPATVGPSQAGAIATAVSQLVQLRSAFPADGSVAAPNCPPSTFGLSFANNGIQSVSTSSGFENAIHIAIGDGIRWMKHVAQDVEHFVVSVAEGVADCVVQIADAVYHFTLNCLSDVIHSVEFVFTKIGVAFDKLVQWLGFVFDWDSILRTHAVGKNLIKCYLQDVVAGLGGYATDLANLAPTFAGNIAGQRSSLEMPSKPIGAVVPGSAMPLVSSSPAAHWATDHVTSNASDATTAYVPTTPDMTSLSDLFTKIEAALDNEKTEIENAYGQVKTAIDQFGSLGLDAVFTTVLDALGNVALETLLNILVMVIDVLEAGVQTGVDALDAVVEVPVLSWMYKKLTGDDLSFLDMACLVTAVPATVIYAAIESVSEARPSLFADDATTTALVRANDWTDVKALVASGPPTTAAASTNAVLSFHVSTTADKIHFLENVSAFASSFGVAAFTAGRIVNSASGLFALGSAACYVPYCFPDFNVNEATTWDEWLNEGLTAISIAKALVDITTFMYKKGGTNDAFLTFWEPASPWFEYIIDSVWMVPAMWPLTRRPTPRDWCQVAANVCFNLAGVFALMGAADEEIISKAGLAGLTTTFMGLYGRGMLLSSFLSDS